MSKILIIDDDKAFCDVTVMMLRKLGHEAVAINSLKNISSLVLQIAPDIILLDIEFPDADGIRKLPDVRMAAPDTPVILITNHVEDEYISRVLKSHADYMLHKPIGLATLKELLNRFTKTKALFTDYICFGNYTLDVKSHELKMGDEVIETLTPQECRFMSFLASHPNEVLTSEEINLYVWGDEVGNSHGTYNLKSKFNKIFSRNKNVEIITMNRIGLRLQVLKEQLP